MTMLRPRGSELLWVLWHQLQLLFEFTNKLQNKFRTCLQIASLVEAGWAFFTILFCGLKDIKSRSFKWSFKGFSFWSFLKEFEVSRSYFWPPKRRRLGWWSALWIFVACNLDLLFLVCNHVERRPCWRSIHRIFSRRIYIKIEFSSERREMLCWPPTWPTWRHMQTSKRAFSLIKWLAAMQIYWNRRNFLHNKKFLLPLDWFWKNQHGQRFIVLGQYGGCDVMWKRSIESKFS